MRNTPRGRGTSAGLSRESIIAAGGRVAEQEGFAGLSLRLVAHELGVTPASLYNHLANKEELVDAVADSFIRELLESPLPTTPKDRIRELVMRLHRAGLDHPGMLSNIIGHIPEQPGSAQMIYSELILSALVETGASEQQAHLLYSILVSLVVGTSVAAVNLRAPSQRSVDDRLGDYIADSRIPLTSRYLKRPQGSQWSDFRARVDFVLRDLTE
ncbi:TetR/AcrR family transcriptional regulator [Rhodococcus sp. APC 3903]|uniref:TetR/AcrR family transcriptional regulator n=1 Tax=Rhodococcus sp. APC 3903 TaxID=3035193 RepID=UPI0025B32F8B|nr:TetR/AcrR family transcriptional regulator [Rhodococcus sp. APC 3903]MDN3460104.1 TetR/AcrR family transcriptional regulator [Rhodococcus sp. APC 3903]